MICKSFKHKDISSTHKSKNMLYCLNAIHHFSHRSSLPLDIAFVLDQNLATFVSIYYVSFGIYLLSTSIRWYLCVGVSCFQFSVVSISYQYIFISIFCRYPLFNVYVNINISIYERVCSSVFMCQYSFFSITLSLSTSQYLLGGMLFCQYIFVHISWFVKSFFSISLNKREKSNE